MWEELVSINGITLRTNRVKIGQHFHKQKRLERGRGGGGELIGGEGR
jgi:hypothetical protein